MQHLWKSIRLHFEHSFSGIVLQSGRPICYQRVGSHNYKPSKERMQINSSPSFWQHDVNYLSMAKTMCVYHILFLMYIYAPVVHWLVNKHIYFYISGKQIHLANSSEIHHTRGHLYTQGELSIQNTFPNTVMWLFPPLSL